MINLYTDLARTVAYFVWVFFAAVATIWGLVYYVDAPERGRALPGASLTEAQAGALQSALASEVRFGRTQQWYTAFLSLLLFAALVALLRIPKIAELPLAANWILPILADCIWGASIIAALVFQRSKQVACIRLNAIASVAARSSSAQAEKEDLEALRERSERYTHHPGWLAVFIVVATVAWVTVQYLLSNIVVSG